MPLSLRRAAALRAALLCTSALLLAQCTSVGSFSNFDPSVSGLVASPNSILADGRMLSNLTLRIFYSPHVPAANVPVQLIADNANTTIVPDSGQSDANGTFTATLSTTHRGQVTVSAAVGGQGIDSTLQTTLTAAAPVAKMVLVAGPALEADTPAVARVTLVDDTNTVVPGYRGTIALTSSDMGATLPSSHTFDANDAGTYTFRNLQFHTVGAQTLTAADTSNPNLQQTDTVQITLHREVRLAVSSPVVAGVPQTLQVAVTDLVGNVVANYAGTLHLTCSDANAVFPSTLTLTAANEGSLTLQQNLVFLTAGLQTLSAVDVSEAGILGSNPNILVEPAGASRLTITGLVSAAAGVQQTMVVTALDAFDNVATGYRGRVRFASSDLQAALPGDTVFDAGDAGVFSYPSVSLLTAGVQTVTATDIDAPLITGDTNALVITNAPATQLLITAASSAVAGVSTGVVVTAFDPYHNQAKDFAGVVTFTTTDPCAQLVASHDYSSENAGSFSFSVTYQTAGVQTLTAQGPTQVGMAQKATVVNAAAMQNLVIGGIVDGPAGIARAATVRATDNFNNTVTAYRGVVHFTSSDTNAQLPTDYGFTEMDAGLKTLGVVLTTVGRQSVAVTDTVNPNWTAVQGNVVVTSGDSKLRVTSPNLVVAGTAFNVVLTAVDAYGNLDANYVGTVHFASPDAQATLPADVTLDASDAGTLAVSGFVFRTATASQTLNAIDLNVSTRNGMRTGIVVQPAAPAALALVAPTTATAGAQLTVTVGAYDIYNNLTPSYTGTVHLSSSDTGATLPGDATFGASDAGTRTYVHGVTLHTEGNQTLTASDGHLTPATATVLVNDAGATTLVLSVASVTTAGAPLDVTVAAEDAYGNVVPGFHDTVVITGQDPNGTYGAPLVFGTADDGNKFSPHQVTLTTAGARLLTATDANNPNVSVANALVTVNPAHGTTFALSAPATSQAGMPFTTTITVYDAYHNIASDYGGTAVLKSDDTQGAPSNTAPLTVQFASGLAAHHDVSGVTLRTAGAHVMSVQDANNASAPTPASANVLITPTVATRFGLVAPSSVAAGAPFSITVQALDSAGNVAENYIGSVTWSSGDANATLPASTAFGSGDQGNVTVSGLKLLQATGSQTIQVVDGNGMTGSVQIGVTPAAATNLQITGASTATAGTPLSVTVTARDIYNNIVTAYANTVHFSSSDTAGTVPPDTHYGISDQGRRNFVNGVIFGTDGNQTITVSDGSLTPAVLAVQVHNGVASSLVLTTPNSATAGVPFNVTLTAQDAYGNTAIDFNGTVTLAGQDANGTYGAPIVFTAANAGTKSLLAYVTLKTSGAQVLTATDANSSSVGVANAVVNVNPASIAALDLNAPATAAAGSPFAVTITGYDVYHNVVNTYASTASLLSDDASGTPSSTSALTVNFTSGSNAVRTITGVTLRSAGDHNLVTQDANNPTNPTPSYARVHVVSAGATHFGITLPASVVAGSAFNANIVALDASGNIDTSYTGTLTWSSGDTHATLPAPTSIGSGAMGNITVSGLVLQQAIASQTVQVVDANGLAGSAQITVTPAAAASLHIGGANTATAGSPMSVIVTAWDIYNNTVTSYGNTVHFVSSDASGTVPSDTHYSTSDQGRHTFVNGVTFRTDGNQTLTVSDGSLTSAVLAVQVTNGAATSMVLTTPASVTAGTSFSVTLTAQDAYGNTASNFNDTVVLGGQDANGTYGAPIVFTSADAGTKTLPSYVTIKASGAQVITATDANSSSVGVSNAVVNVNPAGITALDLNAPTTVAASSPFAVTITGYDAYHNVANSYAGTASLLSDDASGTPSSTSALTVNFTSGSSAVRTITGVTLRSAGDHNLLTQDANNPTNPIPARAHVHVAAAGATHFGITLPASVAAGSAFNANIVALDASGNIATSYTGTLTWSSSDANATLPGTTALGAGNQGNITVSGLVMQHISAGQTVQVVDANGLSGTAQIAVTSAAAHALQLTGPTSSVAGAPLTLGVVAKDIYNNTVSSYTGTVHFITSDGSGTVPSDTTFATADAGSKSFVQGATLRTSGNQNIAVGDGSLVGAILNVNVTNAPASTLALTLPASVQAGTAMNVTLVARDAYGNLVPNFNDTVALSGQDPNGAYGAPIVFTSSNQGSRTLTNYVTLKTAGSQLVVASDATNSNVGVSNAIVSVTPQSIVSLNMNAPAQVAANSPFSVVITGFDTYGNIVTTYGGTASILSDDSLGTPSNTSALTVHFSSGGSAVRTVSGVTLGSAGNHNLTVQDANNSVTPTPYTSHVLVVPAGATHFGLTPPTSVVAGNPFSVVINALDASGNTDPNYTGTLVLSASDPNATVPTSVTMNASNHGSVTVSGWTLRLATPGAQVSATDANGLTGQGSLAVTPASAASLQLAGSPNATAGTPVTVSVTARDTYANIATGYLGTVHFTSDGGNATLPADFNFTSSNAGTKSFSSGITLRATGDQNIFVTDGTLNQRLLMHVHNAAASALVMTLPVSATAGVPFNVNLAAQDAYGNIATDYNGTIVMSSQDGNATYGAPFVFTPAQAGNAILQNDVTLRAAGYTLVTATDVNHTSVSPASVLMPVVAAGISRIGVQAPATATAGVPIVVTVTGYDAFNNTTSAYNGNITLTSTDVQGTPSNSVPLTFNFAAGSPARRSVSGVVLLTGGNITLTGQDLVTTSIIHGNANVAVGPGAATQLNLTIPLNTTAGVALSPVVTAYDVGGNQAPTYTGTVSYTSTDPCATLPASHTFTAGDAGQYTSTGALTLRTSGTQSVSVQDASPGITADTNSITVKWASPNHLSVAVASTATAGTAVSPNVTCFDVFNNVVNDYNGTVHFTSTDPCASLPANMTFATAYLGHYVFTNGAVLTTAGNQNITVADISPGPRSATTSTAITASTGVQVRLSIPATVTAGTPFDVRVIPYDQYGNPNAIFPNAVVSLTPYDSQASVTQASYSFPNPSTGTLLLPSAVTMRSAGTRALFVKDINNASDTSNANTVVQAAALTRFAFGPKEIVTAGVNFNTTLSASDAYGNAVTTYTGTVSVASSDASGTPASGSPLSVTFSAGNAGQVNLTGLQFVTLENQYLTATQGGTSGKGHYLVHYNMALSTGQSFDFDYGEGGGSAPTAVDFAGAAYGSHVTPSGVYYLPDPYDNRVLIYNSFPTSNSPTPNGVLGQPDYVSNGSGSNPNQLNEPLAVAGDGNGGIFITDYANSRILHYNVPPAGQTNADGVLGQPTLASQGCSCTRNGLCSPMTMQVLKDLNVLIVADQYNNRVLFFRPIPISNSPTYANMALGQNDLVSCNTQQGPNGLNQPRGVWSDGTRLVVSDQINHRVLLWNSFSTVLNNGISGVPADYVIGQADLNSNVDPPNPPGPTSTVLRWPNAVESDGTHLFVVDNEYTRVMIYNTIPTSNNVAADSVIMQSNFVSSGCSTYYCGGEGLYLYQNHLVVGMFARGGDYVFTSP